VFALRGDGASKFLGIAPLEFHPEPGTWYTLRAVAAGDRLQVYLNEEAVPRINIRDDDAMWNEGFRRARRRMASSRVPGHSNRGALGLALR
jgi:hypothetical protein